MAQAAGYSFNADTVSGTKVRDLAGYFLTGTVSGSTSFIAGKYSNGLNCTGGAMTVGPIDEFSYPANTDGGLSIGAWVKLNTTTAAVRCIASASANSALKWALYASNASGNVEAKINGVTFTTTTSIRDSAFHHVMLVLDATPATDTVKIYVDGTQVLSTTTATALTYNGNVTMKVGVNAFAGGESLDGVVDDLRWWNDPVESTAIAAIMGAEQVDFQWAIYPFDDDSTNDFSIYNRNLTKTSNGSYVTGLYGRALQSNSTGAGATATVTFGDLDRLAITGWVRLDSAPGSSVPILAINTSGGTSKLRVVVNTNRSITATWVTVYGTYSVTSSSVLTVGGWSRFQIAMNPTYVSVRLDSTTQTITNTSNPTPVLAPTVTALDVLYVGGDQAAGGAVTFDYLTFTKNFVNAPTDQYWTGPPTASALKPANVARGVYEFNENTGTTAADRSASANNLTLTSGGSWMTGVQGSALHSAGTAPNGPGARKASGLAWDATPKGWAVSGWFKCRAASSGARILVLRNTTSEVAHLFYLSGTFQVRLYGSGGTTGILNPNGGGVTAETWTHLAASCNGNSIQFFLNGVWYGSAPYPSGALLAPTELDVGGDTADNAVADVDSLTLFDTPISAANVAWLYANPGQLAASTSVTITRSTTWKVAAQVTRSRSTSWTVNARVTAARTAIWDVLAAVTKTRATSWAVKSQVTSSRVATWDVRTAVTRTRVASWDALAAVTAVRATTWDTLQPVAVSRATGWDVLAGVTVARPTSWRTYALVTATWATTWRTLATLTIERPTTWAIETAAGKVTITRDATWDTRAAVTAARSTTWTVASLVELTRAATWDALASLTRTRATTWRVLKRVSVTRSTQWSVASDTAPEPGQPGLTVSNTHSSALFTSDAPAGALSTSNAPSSQLEVSHGV